jgi:hypothetical protein
MTLEGDLPFLRSARWGFGGDFTFRRVCA